MDLEDWKVPSYSIFELIAGNFGFNFSFSNGTNQTLADEECKIYYCHAFSIFIVVIGIFAFLYVIIGAAMNFTIIVFAATLISKGGAHKTQHLCILSMATADLIFTTVHCPIMGARFALETTFTSSPCMLLYYATHMTAVASSLSLLCLNIDRCVSLRYPLHYQSIITYGRSKIFILSIWLIAISWATFFVFGPLIDVNDRCVVVEEWEHGDLIYSIFVVFFFVIPTFASFGISIYIYKVAQKSRRARQGKAIQTSIPMSHHHSSGSQEDKSLLKESFAKFRTVFFVFCTTIWAFGTLLPYRVLVLTLPKDEKGWEEWLILVLHLVIMSNPVGNPFITAITQPQYRNRFRKLR